MKLRQLLFCISIVVLCGSKAFSAQAREPRAFEGSVKYHGAEGEADEDADRGVLGVKYAIAMDVRRKTHVIVMTVVKGGPADQAGLRRGDRIVQINGVLVKDLRMKEVGPRMRGEPGTKLALLVKRGWDDIPVTIMRGGLMQLPDKAFQERFLQSENMAERDERIKVLSQALSGLYPPVSNAIDSDNYSEALAHLKRAANKDPKILEVQLLYALVLDKQSKFDEAQPIFEEMVGQRPAWAEAWQSLALNYEEQGKYDDAVKALKKTVALVQDKKQESLIRQHISELSAKINSP